MKPPVSLFATVTALTLLSTSGVASAATVTNVNVNGSNELQIVAAPGEANGIFVGPSGNAYVVTDSGAALTAGSGCQAQQGAVSCNAGGLDRVRVTLGDGDDTLTAAGTIGIIADGGDGNDTLDGAGGWDALSGGAGDDLVSGGANAGLDNLNGGPGTDTVSYADRTGPVRVDVDGGHDDGEAGEYDNVGTDVEIVVGGAGNDTLIGGAAANTFHGGAGNDLLDGGDGDDRLYGGAGDDTVDGRPGADLLDAGDGDDTLTSRDSGAADTVACGAGTDSVTADREDALDGCETASVPPAPASPAAPAATPDAAPSATAAPDGGAGTGGGAAGATPPPVVSIVERIVQVASAAQQMAVTLSCGADQTGGCAGTVVVTSRVPAAVKKGTAIASRRGRRMRTVELARAKFKLNAGRTSVVKARISRRGVTQALRATSTTRTAGKRVKRVKAKMSISMRSSDGSSTLYTRPITLEVPAGKG